ELGFRLHLRHVAVKFLPDVVAVHRYPNGVTGLLRRKFWHGRGYVKAWPLVAGVYDRLPTAAHAHASRAFGTAALRGYRQLALRIFRAGMIVERLRERPRRS